MLALLRDCTSESMHPWPHFTSLQYRLCSVLLFTPCCFLFLALQKLISTIHTTLLSPCLRQTSARIQFAIVLGVLGTQEIYCIWLQGRSRETISVLHLSRIDKPVRTPTQCHIDLACNTSYHFAASRTVFPRVSPYLCLGPFAPFGTRI